MSEIKLHNTLLYDGSCPMCLAFASHVSQSNQAPHLSDANSISNPPVPLPKLLERIHLYEEDGTLRIGSDAILTTLSRSHPRLLPVTKLFRLPGFRHIADWVYLAVAQRRKLWFGSDTSRLYWVYLITNIGLLVGILMTWPLWQTERLYPLVPVLEIFNPLSTFSSWITVFLLLSLIGSIVTIQKHRHFAALCFLFLGLLVMGDLSRLQPWVWHYGIFLCLFIFWRLEMRVRNEELTVTLCLAIASIYFWSGVQKLNTVFFLGVFPWFTEPLWRTFGHSGETIFFSLGILVPIFESLIGIGLLTSRFRKLAILAALAMLVLVLSSLVAHDWNSSVWPWNLALFGSVLALFWRQDQNLTDWGRVVLNRFTLAIATLFLVMPLGNFFGFTHHYLSWSLYSGHVPEAYLTASSDLIQNLAPGAPTTEKETGHKELAFMDFTMTTQNVVPYPETWLFESVFQQLCADHPHEEMSLHIIRHRLFRSHLTTETVTSCPDK